MRSLGGGLTVRAADDADATAVTALIGAVYAEYPGCVLDPDGLDRDLAAPATAATTHGGQWWVVTGADGRVVASCAWAPGVLDGESAVEVKRLYVAAAHRGRGLASMLVAQVVRAAEARGAAVVHAWSDTRFTDAHRLYARLAFRRRPETRALHDPSHTTEYHFVRALRCCGEHAAGATPPG